MPHERLLVHLRCAVVNGMRVGPCLCTTFAVCPADHSIVEARRARAAPEASTAVIDQSGEVKALREELAAMRKVQAARPPEGRTTGSQPSGCSACRACRESEATAKKQLKQLQKANKVSMV